MNGTYRERNEIARELYDTFAKDLASVTHRIDEAIGLNSTNTRTREALRSIRSELSTMIKESKNVLDEEFELTNREAEMLKALSTGASLKDIAKKFVITEATVKSHLNKVYRKLGASNRLAAVNEAKKIGIII